MSRRSIPLIALYTVIGLFVVGATVAYGVLNNKITLTVDGRTETVRTFGDTVQDVLDAKGVTVRTGDKISLDPSHELSDGDEIVVKYAKPVTLAVDGKVTEHTMYDATVGEAFETLGIEVPKDAYVSDQLTHRIPRSGDTLVLSTLKKVTVVADGKKRAVTTNRPTAAGVIAEAGLTLGGEDEMKPGGEAFVKANQAIRVVRIKKVQRVEDVKVDYPVKVTKDDQAMAGERVVVSRGSAGRNKEKVTLIYADGKLRERIVHRKTVVKKPVAQVEKVGTQTTAPDSVWDKIAQCESGGNWSINTGNGYYGGLQFSAATWRSVGGPGLPHQHSRETQIKYAKILQKRAGWGQWGCAHARFD